MQSCAIQSGEYQGSTVRFVLVPTGSGGWVPEINSKIAIIEMKLSC